MAPPTIPTEVKKRRGTQRADRPGGASHGALAPVARAPINAPPPATLRDSGIAEWNHALHVCPWIALSDLTALRFLCEAVDRREDLNAKITGPKAELMLETSTGYAYANPILAALEKTEDRIAKWMLQLGMTPSARGALGVAEVKQASTLDALAARRQARLAGHPASSHPSPETPSSTGTGPRSSSSSTPTDASPRTPSPARRALRSRPEAGSET